MIGTGLHAVVGYRILLVNAATVGFAYLVLFLAVAVNPSAGLRGIPQGERDSLERHLNFARDLPIENRAPAGGDVAWSVMDSSRRNRITQGQIARPREHSWLPCMARDLLLRIVGAAKDMQIVIVSAQDPAER